MTDIVKGMAQALDRATGGSGLAYKEDIDGMRAALLHGADWFAADVSAAEFETSPLIKALAAALEAYDKAVVTNRYEQMACAIAAGLRAAAGDEG